MFTKSISIVISALALLMTTIFVSAAPISNAQIEEVYASLIKAKPAKYFKNRKPAILKASFNPSDINTRKTFSRRLHVTATAYTSHVGQTDSTPNIAAWGDRLYPGMKSIAVSRDLLYIYGLKHGQKVRIKGLKGEYAVLDKMNKRWTKKIDIYMGMDKRKAFQWGRRKVEIFWN